MSVLPPLPCPQVKYFQSKAGAGGGQHSDF
jgi:hypothetical protein